MCSKYFLNDQNFAKPNFNKYLTQCFIKSHKILSLDTKIVVLINANKTYRILIFKKRHYAVIGNTDD